MKSLLKHGYVLLIIFKTHKKIRYQLTDIGFLATSKLLNRS